MPAETGYVAGTKPTHACYVCTKKHSIMLIVLTKDGEREVCSPCWRRDYR